MGINMETPEYTHTVCGGKLLFVCINAVCVCVCVVAASSVCADGLQRAADGLPGPQTDQRCSAHL